ncbi:collagen alpha-1(I) chain-like isoform X2 [Bicyclus anynana]|uniref:Collagen alpha-1(I) chain-like isoform X2 n=1 Tax=Bicyclus anynana TaxID=110368 RepID=A0ABM3M333_BICAN|nr:collagen alpha-1(I) chain-like isoform X2 [Bicyclus anynana]
MEGKANTVIRLLFVAALVPIGGVVTEQEQTSEWVSPLPALEYATRYMSPLKPLRPPQEPPLRHKRQTSKITNDVIVLRGPPGSIGPPGSQGNRGYDGQKGDKGDSGQLILKDNEFGVTGPKGLMGEKGPPGPKGYPGPRGVPGDNDLCRCDCNIYLPSIHKGGSKEDPSLRRRRSSAARACAAPGCCEPECFARRSRRETSTFTGPKGYPGAKGEPGDVGPPGRKGAKGYREGGSGTSFVELPGRKGLRGPTGWNGYLGAQGIQGEPGPQGFSGVCEYEYYCKRYGPEKKAHNRFKLEEDPSLRRRRSSAARACAAPGCCEPECFARRSRRNAESFLDLPRGLPGPDGEKGLIGLPGLPGLRGEPGSPSFYSPGAPGDIGYKGFMGKSGPRGYPGPRGPKGERGDCGPNCCKTAFGPSGTEDREDGEGVKRAGQDKGVTRENPENTSDINYYQFYVEITLENRTFTVSKHL